ncbi:MAG: dienelactone hydrolase family protein [Saprospiraceae bacterium]|nr:dienelactone hydrolase family protein [Saprospiraceae bacterium]
MSSEENKLNKEKIPQEVFDLYDDYVHDRMERRDFLQKISVYAVGGLTLPSIINFLMPNYDKSKKEELDYRSILIEKIKYHSTKGGGWINALKCIPSKSKKIKGCVLVAHENRGLNPYIEDVAKSLAVAGFMSLAPDALSPLGGYPGNDDEGRALQSKRDKFEILEDFKAGYDYLRTQANCNGKVGVVGFCFGGWISNMMAVQINELAAAVPYYGGQAPIEEVHKIKAPLLLHFAELDTRVNEGWPAYEKALQEHQKPYTAYIYPKANHGFHNHTTPRYDPAAAELSWKRTLKFFKANLK